MPTTPRTRRAALGTIAVLALALTGLAAGPAGAAAPGNGTAAAQTVVIHTVKDPNLVLDMAGGSANPGTPVVLYGAHGGANQKWEMIPVQGDWFQLRNVASGTCLVNGYHSVENGHELTGERCNNTYEDQLWTRVGVENGDQFTLVNKYSGKCMDQTRSGQQMTRVLQWTCHGLAHQRWTAETA